MGKSFLNATVKVVDPGPPSGPSIGDTTQGTCGHSDWDSNCDTDPQGAFKANESGIHDLAACVARVKKCAMGNVASFSADHDDCSWYSECPGWPSLEDPSIYESQVVQQRGPMGQISPVAVFPYIVHSDN